MTAEIKLKEGTLADLPITDLQMSLIRKTVEQLCSQLLKHAEVPPLSELVALLRVQSTTDVGGIVVTREVAAKMLPKEILEAIQTLPIQDSHVIAVVVHLGPLGGGVFSVPITRHVVNAKGSQGVAN